MTALVWHTEPLGWLPSLPMVWPRLCLHTARLRGLESGEGCTLATACELSVQLQVGTHRLKAVLVWGRVRTSQWSASLCDRLGHFLKQCCGVDTTMA